MNIKEKKPSCDNCHGMIICSVRKTCTELLINTNYCFKENYLKFRKELFEIVASNCMFHKTKEAKDE